MQPRPIHPSRLIPPYDGPKDLTGQMALASALADAKIGIPPIFCGNPGGVLAMLYRAMALDVPVTVALDNIIFDSRGGCAMRARLMKALVTARAGHRLEVIETNPKKAIVELVYNELDGRKPFRAEWTIATAQQAGLIKDKSPWGPYAETMLYWRAMAKAVNLGCPEVLMGIQIVEAMDPEDEGETLAPETIVDDGKLAPDEAVAAILNQLATPDPGTGRPIVRPETTIDDLRRAYNTAKSAAGTDPAPISRFAWHNGEDPLTLEVILSDLAEQVTARDKAAVEAQPKNVSPESDMAAPAGTGILGCGCDANTVAVAGEHQPGCKR